MKIYFGTLLCLVFSVSVANASKDGSCHSGLGLGVVPNHGMATGYSSTVSAPGMPCNQSIVTCNDGVLSGPDLYPSCTDINQDCQGIPNGGSASGYTSSIAPCIFTTVTCVNGMLSGPLPVPSCINLNP